VDDIKTSGATLNECARTLKEAGATKVYALVLAVAGQRLA
jgi:predicted amidophosphoribosyltransferase